MDAPTHRMRGPPQAMSRGARARRAGPTSRWPRRHRRKTARQGRKRERERGRGRGRGSGHVGGAGGAERRGRVGDGPAVGESRASVGRKRKRRRGREQERRGEAKGDRPGGGPGDASTPAEPAAVEPRRGAGRGGLGRGSTGSGDGGAARCALHAPHRRPFRKPTLALKAARNAP